tara:strand:- start:20334 stop:20753 length:420 start_codon:yes stop_codon:yes gene_type:complete
MLSEEKVMSTNNIFDIIFPGIKSKKAAELFITILRKSNGKATKNAVSDFANNLQDGMLLENGELFKYSRRNFYMTVLRTLIDMGFIQKNVPVWDTKRNKTLYVYSRNIFDIPNKPPAIGFWRLSYYICKKWNKEFQNNE